MAKVAPAYLTQFNQNQSTKNKWKSQSSYDLTERSMLLGQAADDSQPSELEMRSNIQRMFQNKGEPLEDDRSGEMELLGLKSKIQKNAEEEETDDKRPVLEVRLPRFVLHPDSVWIAIWTCVILVGLFYTATIMPYQLSFIDDLSEEWVYVELAFDLIFFLDILVNFNVAYYVKDELVTNRKLIMKHYLSGWFAPDLAASFPFSILTLTGVDDDLQEGKLVKIAKLPRIYRIIRMVRIVKVIKTIRFAKWLSGVLDRMNINSSIARGLKFLLMIAFLMHLMSCTWFFIAKIEELDPDTWVVRNGLTDHEPIDQYLFSLYWTLTVLDTIGYGDITPLMNSERIVAIIWIIFGVSFYSYTISNLSVLFYRMNSRNNYIQQKEEFIREFAKNVKLPKPLLKQVKYYVRYNYRNNVFSWSVVSNLLNQLPSKLYAQVYNHIFKDVLDTITFFKNRPPDFISEIMPIVKIVVVHEGYELYSYGSTPKDIFFLVEGRVMVKDKHNAVLFSYVKGSYFGEVELIYKTDRKTTTQIEVVARLLKLDGHDFLAALEKFPEIKREVQNVAERRKFYLQQVKTKFKKAKNKLDQLQAKTKVDLLKLSPLLEDLMNLNVEDDMITIKPELNEEEGETYDSIMRDIQQIVHEINEKIQMIEAMHEEALEFQHKQAESFQTLNDLLERVRSSP